MKTDTLFFEQLRASQAFHFETAIDSFKGLKPTPYEKWPLAWKKVFYKAYPRLKQIRLPEAQELNINLFDVLKSRESQRDFSAQPITKEELSTLCFFSFGAYKRGEQIKRFYPSAGGRYPLEVYPVILNAHGIPEGIYHYHVLTHSLEKILAPPFKKLFWQQLNQNWLHQTAVVFVVTAVFERSEMKYGNRGYRHILTEYGHLAENIYLLSSALKIGCCSVGGFLDEGIDELLDLDPIDESVVGVLAVGHTGFRSF